MPALSERLFNQLDLTYGKADDGDLVIATEADRAIYLMWASTSPPTARVASGRCSTSSTAQLLLPLLEEVEPAWSLDRHRPSRLGERDESVRLRVLVRETHAVGLYHETVGLPGAAEYRAAIELRNGSDDVVEVFLAGRIAERAPSAYSEIVS